MKIAISSCGDDWKAPVDERFGRAKGFFIYDTDTNEASYIDNRMNADAAHGAGISAAESIVKAGVQVIITGRIGPKAGSVFKAAGVTVMTVDDPATVEDACRRFQDGDLDEQSL